MSASFFMRIDKTKKHVKIIVDIATVDKATKKGGEELCQI